MNLFKENRELGKGLRLEKYVLVENDDDVNDLQKAWGICLICYVISKFSGIKTIEEVCDAWNVPYQYSVHKSG